MKSKMTDERTNFQLLKNMPTQAKKNEKEISYNKRIDDTYEDRQNNIQIENNI